MSNVVTVSGMFGDGHTYFSDSPVVIDISGLQWSQDGGAASSPFTIVRVEVLYEGRVVGEFKADTGGQTSISFDISSALRAIWSDIDFTSDIAKATESASSVSAEAIFSGGVRVYREYSLIIYTEYLDSQDGEFTSTSSGEITGGRCAIGGLTELERSQIAHKEDADASHWEHAGLRNGDASTKPATSPERIGVNSITSWVDVQNAGTQSVFYPANATPLSDRQDAHAPLVLRDSMPYVDFLFVNRRGAIETCSGQMLEALGISVDTNHYARVERPTFRPSRSLMAISAGGRKSWNMSSGHQTREWAEWWTMEFLKSRQRWMRYPVGEATGTFVPVIVEPGKKEIDIYDRSKQQMPSVEFTVTLALEG